MMMLDSASSSQQTTIINGNNNNNTMSSSSSASVPLAKAAIVEWVNTSIDPPQSYSCVKEIPAKVAAAIMSDIFGESAFSLRSINFTFQADQTDFSIAKKNCDAVLEGAKLLGLTQTTVTGASWADGVKDFGGILLFWRWLRQRAIEKPLSKSISAASIGIISTGSGGNGEFLQGSSSSAASARSSNDNNGNLPPLSQVNPNFQQQQQQNNHIAGGLNKNNNNNTGTTTSTAVRLSEIVNVVGIDENTTTGADSSSSSSYSGPFMFGGPNGVIAKQLFESNFKELKDMRKHHEELAKAIRENNLSKVVAVLQAGHEKY